MTQIKIELDGMNALLRQLRDLGEIADQVIAETLFDVATDTHTFAVQGIQGGPKTGRVYRRGSVTHQASAPGQYPATDTGRLVSSVAMRPDGPDAYVVGTNVQYGPMLEFGTTRMAARPWLLPSFERAKIGVERELRLRLEAKL